LIKYKRNYKSRSDLLIDCKAVDHAQGEHMKAKLTRIVKGRNQTQPKATTPQGQFWIYRQVQPRPDEQAYDNWYEYRLVDQGNWNRIKKSHMGRKRGEWQMM
jgi:hypothetical protein